jgi:hypothetical protein
MIDEVPDMEARDNAYAILQTFAYTDFTTWGAKQGEHDRFPYMRFSAEGQRVFNEWYSELNLHKIRQEENPLMLEHLGKYSSLMPSLALIFHLIDCADDPSGEVSEDATRLAVGWCEYLEAHARRIYGLVASAEMQSAAALATKIEQGKVADGFAARDVYRKGWAYLDKDETYKALDVLADYDCPWVQTETHETDGRTATIYRINPYLMAGDGG